MNLLSWSRYWGGVSIWVAACIVLGSSAQANSGFRLFGSPYSTHEEAQTRAALYSTDYFLELFSLPLESEAQLLRVSSDAEPGFSDLKIILADDFSLLQIVYYLNPKDRKSFSVADVRKTAVMLNTQGQDILLLRGEKLDSVQGGTLILDYLYNGITGSRGQFVMELLRDGSRWSLWVNGKAGRRIFTTMFLPGHQQWPIGIVGIDHVEVQ